MSEIDNNILIPIDFNEISLIALEQSFNLAKLLKLSLVLLYVNEEPGMLKNLFSDDDFSTRKTRIEQSLEEIAEKVRKQTGLQVSVMVREGKIHSEIQKVAEILRSKFIVMGSRSLMDEGDATRKIFGANTSRVIRSAPCPVISINGRHHYDGCRNILLPLDLTQETRQKVNKAIEVAKLFGSTIKVMSAIWSKNNEAIYNQLHIQLQQVKAFIESAGVSCQAELIESTGKEKSLVPIILHYAEQQGDIDLIIIMTQQELSLIQFFVSSSAQDILRLSEIPVMSVTPRDLGYSSMMS
ncbi:MAG: universal stress protein [Bacteroidetes bacterium]|nr:universal stress protein [Bacteroidota bacterium]